MEMARLKGQKSMKRLSLSPPLPLVAVPTISRQAASTAKPAASMQSPSPRRPRDRDRNH
jgi:hypothetical protein